MLTPMHRLIAAMAVFSVASPARALDATRKLTQYTLQKWDAGTGLPHESIQALVQTPDGYLWLGTMGGLVRFDGVRFTHYTPRNSALPHNNVWSLAVDASGRLWLGTEAPGSRSGRATAPSIASEKRTASPATRSAPSSWLGTAACGWRPTAAA